jgi:hypothetical protein
VLILIEEQDVDEEGEVVLISEASEPITLGSFDTLEEAHALASQLQSQAEKTEMACRRSPDTFREVPEGSVGM